MSLRGKSSRKIWLQIPSTRFAVVNCYFVLSSFTRIHCYLKNKRERVLGSNPIVYLHQWCQHLERWLYIIYFFHLKVTFLLNSLNEYDCKVQELKDILAKPHVNVSLLVFILCHSKVWWKKTCFYIQPFLWYRFFIQLSE